MHRRDFAALRPGHNIARIIPGSFVSASCSETQVEQSVIAECLSL
jgi:hypothetical protein